MFRAFFPEILRNQKDVLDDYNLFQTSSSDQLTITCSKLTIETLKQDVLVRRRMASFWCLYC